MSRTAAARSLAGLLPLLVAAGLLISLPGSRASLADDIGATARAGQWPLKTLRAPDAWRHSRGEGVLVAVLDTGVDPDHPDLAGAVRQGPDFTGAERSRHWGHHGTSMASLIAGRGHGEGHASGVLGVAPAAEILSVRVTLENDDPRRGTAGSHGTNALARGIRYAAEQGADVISMSLGGGSGTWEGSAAEEEAVQYAVERGAVLVASCGNDGAGANRKNFPAAYPGVIAVGAVDERSRVARFSNRQDYVSVVAPGTRIVSADGSGSYVVGDGTSSAAAMVAGIVALIRAEYPELTPRQVRLALEDGTTRRAPAADAREQDPAQEDQAQEGNATTTHDLAHGHRAAAGHDPAYGYGVADAALALSEAGRIARRPPPRVRALGLTSYFGGGPESGGPGGSRRVVVGVLIVVAGCLAARVMSRRRHRP
ncbi:S8 family serine peptidase [Streptosporangium soli]|nr:S8 family serine peptidase [Streptosporangium sp. KLBMP 9127]